MSFGAREADLNRVLGAAGVAGQQELGARGDLMGLTQMGTQMQQFQTQAMLSALGLRPFENVSTVTPGSQGLLQQMIGPAMQGLGGGLGYAMGPEAMDWMGSLFDTEDIPTAPERFNQWAPRRN
jgi:hypothetical protein